MKLSTLRLSILTFLITLCLNSSSIYAQSDNSKVQIEPSFEVALQVIVGSNEAASGSALPANLSAVVRQIKSNFAFTDYRIENTLVGRLGNTGNLEYKSISNILGPGIDAETPSFLEWTLGGLKNAANDKGKTIYQAQPFRFGARVPIRTSSYREEGGKTLSNVNYEAIGLSMNRVSLSENTPTLIGTLSLPKTTGTLFLVLTIRTVE